MFEGFAVQLTVTVPSVSYVADPSHSEEATGSGAVVSISTAGKEHEDVDVLPARSVVCILKL